MSRLFVCFKPPRHAIFLFLRGSKRAVQSGAGKMGINETVFIIGYTLYED